MTIEYSSIFNLNNISLIQGSDKTLTFTVYQSDGTTLQDINGSLIDCYLCPYGSSEYVAVQKTGTIVTDNTFTISLLRTDQAGLSGKYFQQIKITDYAGSVFRAAQGIVIILPGTYE
jgi:hypothetical protein